MCQAGQEEGGEDWLLTDIHWLAYLCSSRVEAHMLHVLDIQCEKLWAADVGLADMAGGSRGRRRGWAAGRDGGSEEAHGAAQQAGQEEDQGAEEAIQNQGSSVGFG